ncbi:MAG: hypothetical protein ACXWG8_05370 [Usitatibacter sp.]
MSSRAELELTYKVANAPINVYPYPHFYIRDVFPQDYYDALQRMLPDPAAMLPIEQVRALKGYKERFVLDFTPERLATLPEEKAAFWSDLHSWLVGGSFARVVLAKFGQYLAQRFQGQTDIGYYDEALLVQDTTDYRLGPHSDAPRKVVTFLFYLPKDDSQSHLGTSIYLPKDREFRCPGGPHHPRENFERLWTMPFLPNSLFVFLKGDRSFHGVEKVSDPGVRRWLLLYDIFARKVEQPG